MRNIFRVIGIAFVLFIVSGCNYVAVDAGQEGVAVKKPFTGGGGVVDTALQPGSHILAITTDVTLVDMRPQRFVEGFDDLVPADQTPIDFDMYATFKVTPGRSPQLLSTVGPNWYVNNVKSYLRSAVRDEARQFTSVELVTNSATLEQIEDVVAAQIREYVTENDIPVMLVELGFDQVSPPDIVLEEIGRTAAQTQRQKTEAAKEAAELARAAAEEARALADKAYSDQFQMTVDQFLQSRALEIEKEKLEIVRNNENVHVIMGSGSAMPTFNVQ